jgi:hypothetical protein
MEPCIQSANVTSPCLTCGGRAKKVHRPLFHRGNLLPAMLPGLRAEDVTGHRYRHGLEHGRGQREPRQDDGKSRDSVEGCRLGSAPC